jgi:hypothetical protein
MAVGLRRRLLAASLLIGLALPGELHAQSAPVDAADTGVQTGIAGQVVLASRCPVPVGDADGVCPTPGFPTVLTIRSADGTTEVAQLATDDSGEFSIALDPGAYLVDAPATAAGPPRVQTLSVIVAPDAMTEITISVTVESRRQP